MRKYGTYNFAVEVYFNYNRKKDKKFRKGNLDQISRDLRILKVLQLFSSRLSRD